MRPVSTGVAAALLSTTFAAAALCDDRQPAPKDCSDPRNTYEINMCADAEFEKADKALNEVYARAVKAVPEMATEPPYDAMSWEAALRKSQRAWVAFRDAECKDHVAMFWSGGSGASADIIGCMTAKTRARIEELKERYEK